LYVAGRRPSDGNDAAPTGRGHGSLKMPGSRLKSCTQDRLTRYLRRICANVTIRILRGEPREMRGLLRTDDRGAQDRGSCDRIRIGVVRSNKGVMTFWTSQGSEATGELRRWHEGRVESEVVYLEKRFS
jgi:hypothetical protein